MEVITTEYIAGELLKRDVRAMAADGIDQLWAINEAVVLEEKQRYQHKTKVKGLTARAELIHHGRHGTKCSKHAHTVLVQADMTGAQATNA